MRIRRSDQLLRGSHPLLGEPIRSDGEAYAWQADLDSGSLPYLRDHRLQGMAVLPGAVYVEMALAAATVVLGILPRVVKDTSFHRVFPLPEGATQSVLAMLLPRGAGGMDFRVHDWTPEASDSLKEPYASLHIPTEAITAPTASLGHETPEEIRTHCHEELPGDAVYARLAQGGNEYGPALRVVERLWRGNGEALAALRLRDRSAPFDVDAVLLDALSQVVAAAVPGEGGLFLLTGLDEARLCGRPQGCSWVHARLRDAHSEVVGTMTGDACLLDDTGRVALELSGVQFKRLPHGSRASDETPILRIAVAATFTAQPLEGALLFWMEELGRAAQVQFAPYGQVFEQLLNPASLLRGGRADLNVLLLRFEDWARDTPLPGTTDPQEKEHLLAGYSRIRLPDGREIAHLNQYETEYLYREIFRERTYLRHQIRLREGDCVVDVGANIGLFTLFVSQECPSARILAFEPAPPVFDLLRVNTALYAPRAKVINCGLADREGEAPFTFYPSASVFSGFRADLEQDRSALQAVVHNLLAERGIREDEGLADRAEELIENRFQAERLTCRLRTLAEVIREEGIDRIDLLKVDAEKSELEVLRGVGDTWDIVRQVVVEVHSPEGEMVRPIVLLLQSEGFDVVVDEGELLRNSGLYMIYAARPADDAPTATALLQGESTREFLEQKLQDFVKNLRTAAEQSSIPYLVCICPLTPSAVVDRRWRTLLEQLEQQLVSAFSGGGAVDVVRPADLCDLYPVAAYHNTDADPAAHIPYTPALFAALGSMIVRRYHARQCDPYKVIALDCDQTLWRGVCGEDGPLGVTIAPSFRELQEFMVRQHDTGMLLCLCSKNNPEDVAAVFERHPEMPLRRDHFISARINWRPKSENLQALAAELGLGLNGFIFLDNNVAECAEVRAHCPQVLVVRLPDEEESIPHFLRHIWAFDHLRHTAEDRRRASFYRDGQKRQASRQRSPTVASFLDSLGLQIRIAEAIPAQFGRIAQLTQRTNQFNCTGIRRTESSIAQLCSSREVESLAVEVRDRFGDHGLVGAVLFRVVPPALIVDGFLLSCRVLGLGVEHRVLARLGELATARGLEYVQVAFVPSGRNQPALDFLQGVGGRVEGFSSTPCADQVGGLLFSFATASLIDLRFDPATAWVDRLRPETGAGASAATSDPSQDFGTEPPPFERIATELREIQQILDGIRSRQHRLRPEGISTWVPARNDTEEMLRAIWQEVLGIQQVGVEDNFFDLGGTSLDAVQVVAELKRRLGRDVDTVTLFEKTTITSLAGMLQACATEEGWDQRVTSGRRRGEARRSRNRTRRRRR